MPDSNESICYGAGGHARVLLDIAEACGLRFTRLVVDERPSVLALSGIPIVEAASVDFVALAPFTFIVAIGRNDTRRQIFGELSAFGSPISLVHPFTSISIQARVGLGVAVMPGVVVNTGATIHDNVILNTSCSIDHDCVIGPHAHICPGVRLAGAVTVGAGTMIGTGAVVIPGIRIGENCTIGAGAVVVCDIPSGSTAYGSPCRVKAHPPVHGAQG